MENEKIGPNSSDRRHFGQHFTSTEIFREFIFPQIRDQLYNFIWVDMFCGDGNLILPILENIPSDERETFFREHIILYDIQQECVEGAILKAITLGIPDTLARQKILLNDSLKHPPHLTNENKYPIYHITNPPYLYLGYIVKHKETHKYLPLFQGENNGLQDLYQIALINDLRHNIKQMIYVIPANFLFGNSVSNKIRESFFPQYEIVQGIIFEYQIFKHTGTNVLVLTFNRKKDTNSEPICFRARKIKAPGQTLVERDYLLEVKYHYKAGSEFNRFVERFRAIKPLKSKYYLMKSEIDENPGTFKVELMDANQYVGQNYAKITEKINGEIHSYIINNTLWIRTVDTGTWEGRAGFYHVRDSFNVDGILVTKNTYRTNPIQIFFTPALSFHEQDILVKYCNLILEHLRNETDSEFMTTYKYSSGPYTRKYFGLSQAKKLIQTFPINDYSEGTFTKFIATLKKNDPEALIKFMAAQQRKK